MYKRQEYDATNKALKITNTTTDEVANLYASGGVSAYGVGSVAGSGGLQGNIITYDDAIASDPQNEGSKIASASSIYKLHSRISNIENNGATSITVTGTGNAITSVSKNGTSITFTKGATFLTSHQSLANYYTKGQVDNIANGKSSTSHTHSVKINGITKTIAATGGTSVDLGTYLTSHQSLADYAKKSEIPTKVSQLTNDKNFVTGSVSGQTITINGVSTTWQNTWRGITDSYSGTSTDTSLSQKGANSLYNALHNGYASSAGNSDKVDGVHVTWGGQLVNASWLTAWENDGSALRAINPADVTVGNSDKVDGYHATDGRTFNGDVNWGTWDDVWSDGTNTHPWYGFDHRYPNTHAYSTTISDYFGMTIKTANTLRLDCSDLLINGTNISNLNVASATKLQTPRTIWGQSFDGTGNVDGELVVNGGSVVCGIKINSNIGEGSISFNGANGGYRWVTGRDTDRYFIWNDGHGEVFSISNNTNFGIGTTSPNYKLHVAGNIYASDTIIGESNKIGLTIRGSLNAAWSSWFAHETSGNEALVIATQNPATAIMLTNGESYSNICLLYTSDAADD